MISLVLALLLGAAGDDILNSTELGPVRVTTRLSPAEPVIGDEIVLEIEVQAAAQVDVLMPEFGEALSRYTIIDYVPRQRVAADGTTTHTQRYTLQPYVSGQQSIPPILVEFVDHRPGQKLAPDDLDAFEILTDRIDFVVQSVLPKGASQELNAPMGRLELRSALSAQTRYGLLAAVVIGCCLLVAGIIYWRSRRTRVIRRNAYEIAKARLDSLLASGLPDEERGIEGFYVEISAIIRRYLEDRFSLRAPELTTEEFLAVAGNSGALTREHQGLLRDFLRQADLVKFAGMRADETEINRSVELAARFLEETRENAPLVDSADAVGSADIGVKHSSITVEVMDAGSQGDSAVQERVDV